MSLIIINKTESIQFSYKEGDLKVDGHLSLKEGKIDSIYSTVYQKAKDTGVEEENAEAPLNYIGVISEDQFGSLSMTITNFSVSELCLGLYIKSRTELMQKIKI